jgi:hypothetical protein
MTPGVRAAAARCPTGADVGVPRARGYALTIVVLLVVAAVPVTAQNVRPEPPGPFVIDVRGATAGLPQAFGFYPPLPQETLVPARGFGVDVGAHVYIWRLGPARVGAGANLFQIRGTTDVGTSATARLIAPQISFNFGTSEGWSYVSGGVGTAQIEGRFSGGTLEEASAQDTGVTMAMNLGAGARWFFMPRLAVGFDLRLHRISPRDATTARPGTPGTMVFSASAGLSVK